MKNIDPNTELGKIIAAKKIHLQEQKTNNPYTQLEQAVELSKARQPYKGPGFFDALKSKKPKLKIIAEVKQSSPSRGVIRDNFSLSEINDAYQSVTNVVAISVLTEKDYFHGSEEILSFFSEHNKNCKPLLRKDFIFDPYQILETKLLGAQAYLLIASLFDDAKELEGLIKEGRKFGLETLVEVHNKEELELVKSTSARIIGVNCRDMKTFAVDPKIHELLREIDDSYVKVAESGIDNGTYLNYLSTFCDAALVGSHFMSKDNIEDAIKDMVKS